MSYLQMDACISKSNKSKLDRRTTGWWWANFPVDTIYWLPYQMPIRVTMAWPYKYHYMKFIITLFLDWSTVPLECIAFTTQHRRKHKKIEISIEITQLSSWSSGILITIIAMAIQQLNLQIYLMHEHISLIISSLPWYTILWESF